MKKALPENGKIAKDAKETVQECVSEFISFITSEVKKLIFNINLFLFFVFLNYRNIFFFMKSFIISKLLIF